MDRKTDRQTAVKILPSCAGPKNVGILLQFCNPVYVTLGIIFAHVIWQIIGSVRALEFGAHF